MFVAYIIVTLLAAAANIYAATNDFTRPDWLLANMNKLGVRKSLLPTLGILKAAGALGLVIGYSGAADWDCLCCWTHAVLYRRNHHPSPSARLLLRKRRASRVPCARRGSTPAASAYSACGSSSMNRRCSAGFSNGLVRR